MTEATPWATVTGRDRVDIRVDPGNLFVPWLSEQVAANGGRSLGRIIRGVGGTRLRVTHAVAVQLGVVPASEPVTPRSEKSEPDKPPKPSARKRSRRSTRPASHPTPADPAATAQEI